MTAWTLWHIFVVTVILLLNIFDGEAANILILHPLYAGSHELVLRIIGDQMVARGHSVTQIRYAQTNTNYNLDTKVDVITMKIDDSGYPCHRYVNRRGEFDITNREMALAKILWNSADAPYTMPLDLYCVTHVHCKMLLEDDTLFKQLNASNFDLALVDLIANECSLALARALGLPVATFWGFAFQGGEVQYTSNWNPVSLVPAFMSGLDRNMGFLDRCMNMIINIGQRILQHWQASVADIYIQRHYPSLISSAKLVHDIDIAFVHTNFFVDYPRLVAPNTKYVGGMHIREGSPLPEPFRDWVEGAQHGVVMFSLGYTGFEPKDVPEVVVSSFINAFASIKQRVIMRFDASLIQNIPKNVMIVDWFPQHDLLAHNNTVLFVSHCGMNGVLESLYHRVPILAMPIFADQPDNAARIVERGLGLKLDRHNLNTKLVTDNIQEILNNHKYQDKVNLFADMWRDQRTTGFEDAVYWMELLLKYGNLDHLKINDSDLNLFQYLCHDVILFFVILIIIIVFLIYRICRYIIRKISQTDNDTVMKTLENSINLEKHTKAE